MQWSMSELKVATIHFVAMLQCSRQCRDGNMGTAIYCNADAVEYERNLKLHSYFTSCATQLCLIPILLIIYHNSLHLKLKFMNAVYTAVAGAETEIRALQLNYGHVSWTEKGGDVTRLPSSFHSFYYISRKQCTVRGLIRKLNNSTNRPENTWSN